MNQLIEIVRAAMLEVTSASELRDGGVLVSTPCLYPSNGFVQVAVRGANSFIVSDNGGALHEVQGAGVTMQNPELYLRHLLPECCMIYRGVIQSRDAVSRDELPVMIAAVANASKEVAEYVYRQHTIKRRRDFKKMVADFLKAKFEAERVKHEEVIVGASNTPHKFENVVHLPRGRRLVVDAVLHEFSSINARVVANLDVKNANKDDVLQRIVYDEEEDWTPSNFSLLSIPGVPIISFATAQNVLPKIALEAGLS